jgi:hypothetical protein
VSLRNQMKGQLQTQSCANVVRRLALLAARSDLYGVVRSDYGDYHM